MNPDTRLDRSVSLPLTYPPVGLAGEPEGGSKRGGTALVLGIWAPTLLLAGGAFATGYYPVGLAVGGLAMLVHSIIDPRVAVIAMVAVIPCDWMATVIPHVSTASKLLGVWALFVSLPKLLPSVAPSAWDPSAKWIGGMIAWAAVGLFWARYPLAIIGSWQSLVLTWGIPVLICVHFKDMASIRSLLIMYVVGCTLSSVGYILVGDVYGAVEGAKRLETQTLIGGGQEEGVNPNSIARNLGLAFFSAIYLLIVLKGVARRFLLVSGLMLITLAILILKARAVYLALPVSLLASVVLLKGGGLAKRVVLALVIGFIGGGAAFVSVKAGFLGKGIEDRFSSIFEEGFEAGNRLDLWQAHLRVFLKSGLLGVGLAQTNYRSDTLYLVAHNDWISILAQLGIVGFTCLFMFNVGLARRMWRLGNTWTRMFCLALWIFVFIGGLTEDDFVIKHYTIAAGFILAMVRIEEEQTAPAAIEPWRGYG